MFLQQYNNVLTTIIVYILFKFSTNEYLKKILMPLHEHLLMINIQVIYLPVDAPSESDLIMWPVDCIPPSPITGTPNFKAY